MTRTPHSALAAMRTRSAAGVDRGLLDGYRTAGRVASHGQRAMRGVRSFEQDASRSADLQHTPNDVGWPLDPCLDAKVGQALLVASSDPSPAESMMRTPGVVAQVVDALTS
jgi:hypothetical protein